MVKTAICTIVASLCLVVVQTTEASSRLIHSYSTSYCLHGTMADGSYTRRRSVASNFMPFGTKIRLVGRSFYGMRRFIVRDTGSALFDGHLDLWHTSCSNSITWGRRSITFHFGWQRRP